MAYRRINTKIYHPKNLKKNNVYLEKVYLNFY